jgi:hypothetical protein
LGRSPQAPSVQITGAIEPLCQIEIVHRSLKT